MEIDYKSLPFNPQRTFLIIEGQFARILLPVPYGFSREPGHLPVSEEPDRPYISFYKHPRNAGKTDSAFVKRLCSPLPRLDRLLGKLSLPVTFTDDRETTAISVRGPTSRAPSDDCGESMSSSSPTLPSALRSCHRNTIKDDLMNHGIFLRAQSELLEAALTKNPEQAIEQRDAITGQLRQRFINFVSGLQVPLVLEIGAHEGSFSQEMKRVRPEARVIAFEAHPLVHARWAPTLEEAGVEYLPLAIAEKNGTITLNVSGKRGSESFEMGSLLRHKKAAVHSEYDVQAVTLDSFLGDAVALPNAMWIDVDGALAHVFRGAEHTLANCQALHVEMEHKMRWHDQMIDDDVIAHLANYGLKPVLRDIQKRSIYNAIFMREGVFPRPIAGSLKGSRESKEAKKKAARLAKQQVKESKLATKEAKEEARLAKRQAKESKLATKEAKEEARLAKRQAKESKLATKEAKKEARLVKRHPKESKLLEIS